MWCVRSHARSLPLRDRVRPPRCITQVCGNTGDKSNEAALRALLERPPAVKPRAPATPVAAPAVAGGAGDRSPAVAAPAAAGGWLGGLYATAPAPTADAAAVARERDSLAATLAAAQAEVARLRGEVATRDATIAVRDRDAKAAAAALTDRDRAIAVATAEREAARKSVMDRDATIAGLRRELDAAAAAAAPLRDNVTRLTAANELMHAVLHPPLEAAVQSAYLRGEDVALVRDGDGDRVRLGGGAQGDVYAATLQCVAKVPKPPKGAAVHSDATVAAFWQEVAFHQPLCHPHIVAVHGGTIVADPATGRAKELRMVMERCGGGTLEGRLHGGEGGAGAAPGPLRQRLAWCGQALSALVYLHARDIIHADLKPENVLLEDGSPGARAKVTDFGLAKQRADAGSTHASHVGARGSYPYMDPALLAWDAPGGAAASPAGAGGVVAGSIRKPCDVYSAGVLLWELATVRRPYADALGGGDLRGVTVPQLCAFVLGGGRPGTPEQLAALAPAGLGALIGRMWAARAEDRPTAATASEELARLAAGMAAEA
jgi:hypothetical protein